MDVVGLEKLLLSLRDDLDTAEPLTEEDVQRIKSKAVQLDSFLD